ncbi:DUF6542 domain-containing protein [Mycolicibacterium sp. XJ870]
MSGQRAESAVPTELRSVHPGFVGVPWWGAVLLGVTATAVGFAFDAGSGDRELSAVFAVCYVLGCLSAVLAVRQSGLFTAVIQPPLILFVAVPGSYFLFHGGQLGGLKDLAINCGYPLIERFPLMLFTSAAVLLIGLARWYFGLTTRRPNEATNTRISPKDTAAAAFVSSVTEKFSALLFRKPAARGSEEHDPDAAPPPRRRPAERPTRRRPATAEGASRTGRKPTKRTTPPRSRSALPIDGEPDDIAAERPRRPRSSRTTEPPLVPPGEPHRRVRTQPREPRKQPPTERRGGASQDRPQRRRRFDDYQPFEDPFESSFEPTNGHPGRSTHHPVSRVRYRGSDDEDHRTEYRTRPRSSSRGRHSRDSD